MNDEIWVLGATGRTGRAVAARLRAAGHPVVLVGRDRERLVAMAGGSAGGSDGEPRIVVGSLDAVLAELARSAPAVVVNTVGPFTDTAARVARACPPGTHHVDVANEFGAVQAVLDLDRAAADAGSTFVTGAGFGVLATESVLMRVCQGEPTPSQVRVDAAAAVATEPGAIGTALASSILGGLPEGGRRVRHGRIVRSPVGAEPERLTTPDGDVIVTGSLPSGELLAAWRASGADSVIAASSMVPTGTAVRVLVPVASAVMRVPAVARFAIARLARVRMKARDMPRPHSWAHARVEWPTGAAREGWLRAGDGMDFTAGAAAEVVLRLVRGEGRPGAHTPAALFGPDVAIAAGGEFLVDGAAAATG